MAFKKVRVTDNKRTGEETEIAKLHRQRMQLKDKHQKLTKASDKQETEAKLNAVEEHIADLTAEKNVAKIKEHFSGMSNIEGKFNHSKMWKLKSRVLKRPRENPTAKKDSLGNLVTSKAALRKLYVETYKNRLSKNEISKDKEKLWGWKQELCRLRMEIVKENKTIDWNLKDLEKIIKKLKTNKASDPSGLINELFKVAGEDLKQAIVHLANQVKNQHEIPEILQFCDITSIYKNKGSKFDLDNERGIFSLPILRSIIDKLIYEDEYEGIDSNMSDSNVGARKNKNIRNNLFIIYGVLNWVKNGDAPRPIDVAVYDISKCYDKMSLEESLNDLYDKNFRNDKLSLLYDINKKNLISIRTPLGKTERFEANNIVAQGGSWGGIKCASSMDSISSEMANRGENIYFYKNCVPIPTLGMIDDNLNISNCGMESLINNTVITEKVEMKNLKFNSSKCHKIHIGKVSSECPQLKANGEQMSSVEFDKYLGDIIGNVKLSKNIQSRKNRGVGIISTIMGIVQELCLGNTHYFEVAIMLRNCLFVNSLFSCGEAWYSVKQKDVDEESTFQRT